MHGILSVGDCHGMSGGIVTKRSNVGINNLNSASSSVEPSSNCFCAQDGDVSMANKYVGFSSFRTYKLPCSCRAMHLALVMW
jgi:hypothetical protein